IILLVSVMIVPSFNLSVLGGSGGQEKPNQDKARSEHKKARVVDGSEGSPVLWEERAGIKSLDLFFGPGGREGAPDLTGKFTYAGRDPNGTQKKVYAKDDKDREWTVKFGPEARPETVATRIVWAMGYHTDEDYFLERVHIDGMPGGDAENVRF